MLLVAAQHRRSPDSGQGEQSTPGIETETIPEDEFRALDEAIRAAESGTQSRMIHRGSHSAPGSMRAAVCATARGLRSASRAAATAGPAQQAQHARNHAHPSLVLPPPDLLFSPRALPSGTQQRRAVSGDAGITHQPASTAPDPPQSVRRSAPGFAAPKRLPETAAAAAARQRSLQRSRSQPVVPAGAPPVTPAAAQQRPPSSLVKPLTGDSIVQEAQGNDISFPTSHQPLGGVAVPTDEAGASAAQHAQHAQHVQHESEAFGSETAGLQRHVQRTPVSAPVRAELALLDIEEAGLVKDRIASNRFWGLSVTDIRYFRS